MASKKAPKNALPTRIYAYVENDGDYSYVCASKDLSELGAPDKKTLVGVYDLTEKGTVIPSEPQFVPEGK